MGCYEKQIESGEYAKDNKEDKDFCCEVYIRVITCENDGDHYEDKNYECREPKEECRPKLFIDVSCPCEEKGWKGRDKECRNIYVNVDFCKKGQKRQ